MEESSMAGRFDGVSDLEWRLFEDVFPPAPPKRGRGMPHAPFRKVLNTLLYVLITGCRWCDVPQGPQWASKSATHRWLRRWQTDGTLAAMQARILGGSRGTRHDSVGVWRRRWRFFPLARVGARASPTAGKAQAF